MVTTRTWFPTVLLVPVLAVGAACGADSDEASTSLPAETPSAVASQPVPPTSAGAGSDAEAYAKVVMSTNMSEVFSGYEVDGATVRFTTAPGKDLDDASCQYLRMSNTALRESAGLSVVVVTDGAEVEC